MSLFGEFGSMKITISVLVAGVLAGFAFAAPASAYSCSEHYDACLRYGHSTAVCACARGICRRSVGSGDAGAKWNGIPGINACFRK
jgi:hypothetical protein